MLQAAFQELWSELSSSLQWFLLSTESRLHWLFILSSIFLALLVWRHQRLPLASNWRKAFGWSVWTHPSSRIDALWLVMNRLLRRFMIIPVLGSSIVLAISINRWLYHLFGEGDLFYLPEIPLMILFTFCVFIVEDFSRFCLHLAYHKVPWLWRFHAVHHSAEVLTPLTLYRIHVLEMGINALRDLLVIGGVSGVFLYLFAGQISSWEIMGVGVLGFLFSALGANLRHSHVWLSYGVLERFFISPAQHQLHHSLAPEHHDKNFGTWLSLWDRLAGSYLSSQGQQHQVSFGLDEPAFSRSWWQQIKGWSR
ncbi:MAG: sterol desaturase family protein [Pseudomonadota bacterium]|nr:sterol desaturase family protein [Pseudomonadota bacterium]